MQIKSSNTRIGLQPYYRQIWEIPKVAGFSEVHYQTIKSRRYRQEQGPLLPWVSKTIVRVVHCGVSLPGAVVVLPEGSMHRKTQISLLLCQAHTSFLASQQWSKLSIVRIISENTLTCHVGSIVAACCLNKVCYRQNGRRSNGQRCLIDDPFRPSLQFNRKLAAICLTEECGIIELFIVHGPDYGQDR